MIDQPHDNDPDIVPNSIGDLAVAPDAPPHDADDQWLETVLASLPERSREAREALLKALVDGAARSNPAGLTTFTKQPENLGKPLPKRSQERDVYDLRLRSGDGRGDASARKSSGNGGLR